MSGRWLQLWRNTFQQWIDRRTPVAASVTLNQRRIFIIPSRTGFAFLALLLVMLVAAINYQNNMAFMLVFFLASLLFVAVYHTYANLSGLKITAVNGGENFVAEPVAFQFRFSATARKPHLGIAVGWQANDLQLINIAEQNQQLVTLYTTAIKRGRQRPGRLLIETVYPLGLLRAWTWLAMDVQATIYPKPIKGQLNAVAADGDSEGDITVISGDDELVGLKTYTPGDSLRRIHWHSYAKGQPLQSKDFAGLQLRQHYLDWQAVEGDVEQRLSILTAHLLRLDNQAVDYGLRLPGFDFEPGQGVVHRRKLLTALACYGLGEQS